MDMFRTQSSNGKRTKWASLANSFTAVTHSPQKHPKQKSDKNETEHKKQKLFTNRSTDGREEYCSFLTFPLAPVLESSSTHKNWASQAKKCTANQYASLQPSSGRVSSTIHPCVSRVHHKADNTYCGAHFTANFAGNAPEQQLQQQRRQPAIDRDRRNELQNKANLTERNTPEVCEGKINST